MSECQAYEISELGTYEKALEAKQPTCTLTARPEVDPNVPENVHAPGVDRAKEAAQSAPQLALSSAPLRLQAARRTGPSAPGSGSGWG